MLYHLFVVLFFSVLTRKISDRVYVNANKRVLLNVKNGVNTHHVFPQLEISKAIRCLSIYSRNHTAHFYIN